VGSAPGKLGRRTYVIDRGFQLKYTLMLVISAAVISSVFGGLMYIAHVEAVQELAFESGLAPAAARTDEATILWLLGGMTVLMAGALALFGVLITHRVAGPVYVMSHYISVLAKGRYPMMRPLRKGDELRAFFDRFQSAVEALRQREAQEADAIREALVTLDLVATTPEQKKAAETLRAIHDRKRDATDVIKTGAR
jgi:hypothetical protein